MVAIAANKKGAWNKVVEKAFKKNRKIQIGNPTVMIAAGVPNAAAKVGTLCWDETNSDAYICTVAAGTWVKIND